MSSHRIEADLALNALAGGVTVDGGLDRPALIAGVGDPDDTTDVGMVYIRLDGTAGNEVLYIWDNTAGTWDVVSAA